MASIYKYQLVVDEFTTHRMHLPVDADGNHIGQEIANIKGVCFVSIPDGVSLPEQPEQLKITKVTMTAKLLKRLKRHSPHMKLIKHRVREAIAAEYSMQDEIKLLRRRSIDKAAFKAYQTFVESCRAKGKAEKAKLGLVLP